MTLNNLGNLLKNMGRPDDAKIKYERALEMREALLKTDPESSVYQSWVATTLNNLGALLSDMGRPDDAKIKYECALEMYEELLEKYPANNIFQSSVVQTALALAQTMINLGDLKEKKHSLQYYEEANKLLIKKSGFFQNIGLKYEFYLTKRLSLLSKLKYDSNIIELEKKPHKRATGYRDCAKLASQLADIEYNEEHKKKWSGMVQYYEGRALVNDSITVDFDRETLKKAVETFKKAASSCDEALPCYCVYDALLQVTGLAKEKTDLQVLKQRLSKTRKEIPKGATGKCLLKIEHAIDNIKEGADIGSILQELNDEIISIEHSALREIFKLAAHEISEFTKNPFEVDVKFQNWHLWGSISGIDGRVRISVRGNEIGMEYVKKIHKFSIQFEPENFKEIITFEPLDAPHLTKSIGRDCCELIDGKPVFFLKKRAM